MFGVHGVGGFTGTLLTGVFAAGAISATADAPGGLPGLLEGNPGQVLTQAYGVAVTIVWAGGITWGLLRVIDLFSPLRVTPADTRSKASTSASTAKPCNKPRLCRKFPSRPALKSRARCISAQAICSR